MTETVSAVERCWDKTSALTLELWLPIHPDLRHTARVRALMDYLYGFLCQRRELFEGKALQKGG